VKETQGLRSLHGQPKQQQGTLKEVGVFASLVPHTYAKNIETGWRHNAVDGDTVYKMPNKMALNATAAQSAK
jgi:hypothetical protein